MEWGSTDQLSHKPLLVLLEGGFKEMQGVISSVGKMCKVCVNKHRHPESSSTGRNDAGESTPYGARLSGKQNAQPKRAALSQMLKTVGVDTLV